MDRIERALDLLIADHVVSEEQHKKLLTAQVALTDKVDKLADQLAALAKHTNDRFAATDGRLNALITIVDGIIRRPPASA